MLSVDNTLVQEFNIKYISQDDYYTLVKDDGDILSNTLYIVSSDSLNMYDERIINVGLPLADNDAATKQYVDNLSSTMGDKFLNIKNSINKILPLNNSLEDNCNTVDLSNIISCLMSIRDALN